VKWLMRKASSMFLDCDLSVSVRMRGAVNADADAVPLWFMYLCDLHTCTLPASCIAHSNSAGHAVQSADQLKHLSIHHPTGTCSLF
jgi:hypothetical protein